MTKKISTDDMLATFLFDDAAMIFLATPLGDLLLREFSQRGDQQRMDYARKLRESGFSAEGSSVIVIPRPPAFPPALPQGAIIGLSGAVRQYRDEMADAPMLDADGYPLDPAAAMPVYARLAH